MNPANRATRRLGVVGPIALALGILSATGCTDEEVDLLLTGVTIVADEFLQGEEEEEISFSDWLASELSD